MQGVAPVNNENKCQLLMFSVFSSGFLESAILSILQQNRHLKKKEKDQWENIQNAVVIYDSNLSEMYVNKCVIYVVQRP